MTIITEADIDAAALFEVKRRLKQKPRKTVVGGLSEAFLSGHKNWKGDPVELFKNPSRKEYLQVLANNSEVRALIWGDDLVIWNVFSNLHANVMDELKAPNTVVPVVIYGKPGQEAGILITDASKHTQWHHNPDVKNAIRSCAALRKLFPTYELSYYDEDIVGTWDDIHDHGIDDYLDENSDTIRIYRGEYSGNRGGKFWTQDKEFARQFTQSGQDHEILVRYIARGAIKDCSQVYAGDPDAVDEEARVAASEGYKAIMLNEGAGEPNSIWVFDKTALKRNIKEATVVNDGRSHGEVVYKNPTQRTLVQLAHKWGDMRGTVGVSGVVYVWPAMHNTHASDFLASTIRTDDDQKFEDSGSNFYYFKNGEEVARQLARDANEASNHPDTNRSWDWAIVDDNRKFSVGPGVLCLDDFKPVTAYTNFPKMARLLKHQVAEWFNSLSENQKPDKSDNHFGNKILVRSLRKGTILYHGTSNDWNPKTSHIRGPAWFGDKSMAEQFGEEGRVLIYKTTTVLKLMNFFDHRMAAMFNDLIDRFDDHDEMARDVLNRGLDGWFAAPDEIMIGDTSHVQFMGILKTDAASDILELPIKFTATLKENEKPFTLKLGSKMTTVDINQPKVIKLGSKVSSSCTEFMEDYIKYSTPHPINTRARVLDDVATMEVSIFDRMIHISDIVALKPGGGRQALKYLCDLADKHDVKLTLTAKRYHPSGKLDTQQLKAWYERHGFVDEEDSFGSDREGWDMIRWPL